MTGSVGSKKEFEEACRTVFDQGTPCLGCPYDDENSDEYEAVEIISLPLVSEQNCKPYGQFVQIEGVGELSQCVTHDR